MDHGPEMKTGKRGRTAVIRSASSRSWLAGDLSLCGEYDVSNSAMVARLLDLQSIVAVLFKVDLEWLDAPDGRRVTCRTSLGRRVQLLQPPSAATEAILMNRPRGLTQRSESMRIAKAGTRRPSVFGHSRPNVPVSAARRFFPVRHCAFYPRLGRA